MRRRTFFHLGTASTATSLLSSCGKKTSDKDVRIAVVGLHGKGKYHIADVQKADGARIVAICDVDTRELEEHGSALKAAGVEHRQYTDYRKLCEDPGVDAIIIATPNHTHTLIALTAIAAGKHVYVEKPVSHNIQEGRLLVQAAEKHPKLIITHGMQRRSDKGWASAVEWIKGGHIGPLTLSRGLNYKGRESIDYITEAKKIPKAVDYNLWCGPRPMVPIMRRLFHYDWHWQWAYGNGDIGNQGPHQMDVARWALGHQQLPSQIMSLGQRWGYKDNGETPNNQLAYFKFPQGAPLLFDNRGLPAKDMDWKREPAYKGIRIGNVIHAEKGFIAESKAFDAEGNQIEKFELREGGQHLENFIASIQAGKLTSENMHVLQGHLSAAMVHAANVSYRLGKSMPPAEIKERLQTDKEALATLDDFATNLQANRIDMGVETAQVGPWLSLDPQTERFTGEFAPEANALLDEEYRSEFSLPKV
jgi:predicted dehydrogenase